MFFIYLVIFDVVKHKCQRHKQHKFPQVLNYRFSGFGKFNLFCLVAVGGCLMCVITESMCAMFITPAAQCDLNLSLGDKGLLYSAGFLGIVSSSYIWGYFADTKGRKNVILITLVFGAIISIIGSFITTTWLFILLRFWNGFL